MDKFDIYYRALTDYRVYTRENNECIRQRKAISRADAADDVIEVEKVDCEIDDDWIEAIERGMEYIGKAIAEERQFILSNGEVVAIEKVKNVSRESVEHLAKHSNLLTKKPEEGKGLIPDQLYTVERLTDFAVYENRFLYMLLCYLRDFISLRYNAILELVTTYSGNMTMKKNVNMGNRQLVYEVTLNEKQRNDEFLRQNNPSKDKLAKIDGLLKGVLSYLSTPLMDEVSKSPMLKPPITETNVLKMNQNFKGAMQLYYFITSYDKKGYSWTKTTRKISPFKDETADDFAEAVELGSFLTYVNGMGIKDILKENYEIQLAEERKEAEAKKLEQIKNLKKRIKESGESPEEYMLLLEQRNRDLESDSRQLVVARSQIEHLNGEIEQKNADIAQLNQTVGDLNGQISEKEAEIARLNEEHLAKLKQLEEEYNNKLAQRDEEHSRELAATNERWQAKYDEQKSGYIAEIEGIKKSAEEEREAIKSAAERQREELEGKLAASRGELDELKEEHGRTEENLLRTRASLNAIKQRYGAFDGTEDYNSNAGFDQLEREYEFIKALFQKEWKKTKKSIRKKYLKVNNTPAQKELKTAAASDAAQKEISEIDGKAEKDEEE